MTYYTLQDFSIGLDISKATISVYIPIKKIDLEIENSVKGFKSLLSKLKKLYKKDSKKLIFVYEPTGSYSVSLLKFCSEKEINCFIINPKRSHNFAKASGARNKNDKLDGRLLSEAIVLGKKDEIMVPVIDASVDSIKELISYYKFIVKKRVNSNNHLESVEVKDGNKYVIKSLEKEIKDLKKKEKEIVTKIKTTIFENEDLKEKFDNMKSIVGIGDMGAIALIHLFIKYPEANKKQLTSLVGLDPIEFKSGSSIHKRSKISKAGAKIYRGTLFLAAMVASRRNPELSLFFNRLKENGKHTTVAHIAVMRKLIVIAHALFKSNQPYNSEVYSKHCGIHS